MATSEESMTTTDLEVGGAHDGASDEHAPYRYYYAVALSYVCMYAATDPSHIPPLEARDRWVVERLALATATAKGQRLG